MLRGRPAAPARGFGIGDRREVDGGYLLVRFGGDSVIAPVWTWREKPHRPA